MTLSGQGRRAKGVSGEREVAKLFAAWHWTVRGLEGLGDHIATRARDGRLDAFHLEVKRQERLDVPGWVRQCAAETPEGMTPLVCYRRSREPWMAVLPLAELLRLLDG